MAARIEKKTRRKREKKERETAILISIDFGMIGFWRCTATTAALRRDLFTSYRFSFVCLFIFVVLFLRFCVRARLARLPSFTEFFFVKAHGLGRETPSLGKNPVKSYKT